MPRLYLQKMFECRFYGRDNLMWLSQLIVCEQAHPATVLDNCCKVLSEQPHKVGSSPVFVATPTASEFIQRHKKNWISFWPFKWLRDLAEAP
jgi:hypothetical protein